MRPRLCSGALALVVLATGARAHAYCLTHDCNPANPAEHCEKDDAGCVLTGSPLSWPSLCVSFSVQADGSPKYGISAADFAPRVQAALESWASVLCSENDAGLGPALRVSAAPIAGCKQVEYNDPGGNANIWMFRDSDWPYIGGEDAVGLTTVHYSLDAPIIQDADVEINSTIDDLSVGDPVTGVDLDSILTHEAGHFLGLSHTLVPGATMLGDYALDDDSVRTLEPDDVAAICAAYPAGRTIETIECTPRHGFAPECGGGSAKTPEPPRYHGCSLGGHDPRGAGGERSLPRSWGSRSGAAAQLETRRALDCPLPDRRG